MHDELDPRRLLVFRAVAREGSLAAAARRLGWTQPAVAQHVSRLERDLGTPLVERLARGTRLTEAGAVLARHADAVASRLEDARAEVASLVDLQSGTVTLAAFPSACARLVPPALSALRTGGAGVVVRLVEVEPPEAIVALLAGEVDLAVVFSHAQWGSEDGVQSLPLLRERVELVLPAGRALRGGLASLADEPWVAGCVRCREHLLTVCAATGFVPDVRYSTDDYLVAQRLVADGLAVTLLPAMALDVVAVPGVRRVRTPAAGTRTVELLARPGTLAVPAVAAVSAALRRAA